MSENEKLSLLGQNKHRLLLSNNAYVKLTRFLRLFLPLVALCIVAALFLWPHISAPDMAVTPPEFAPLSVAKNELLKPRFESRDNKNQPFVLTANRAVQSDHDPNIVLLESPTADITLENGAWIAAQSKNGIYNQTSEDITLQNEVHFYHDDGYHMKTDEIILKMSGQTAHTDSHVYVQGAAGYINAEGLQFSGKNKILIFKGPVSMTLNQSIKGL